MGLRQWQQRFVSASEGILIEYLFNGTSTLLGYFGLSPRERKKRDRSTRREEEFVCVEVLWLSQPNGVMSNAVSLHNHNFTIYWTDLVLGRERMIVENILRSISKKKCCQPWRKATSNLLIIPLIQEGQLSVSGERMCTILVNRLED